MSNEENSELNDILKDIDSESDNESKNKNIDEIQPDVLIYTFLIAIQGLTKVVSDHTGLQSVYLTDQDVNTLKEALKPFTAYILKLVNFIIYLPIITFAIGYTIRIMGELKQKKKDKKNTEIKTDVVKQ